MNKKARDILAELTTKLEIHKVQIRANPLPYLQEANNELRRARQCFEDLQKVLSPSYKFDFAKKMEMPPNIVESCTAQLDEIDKIVQKYFNP